MSGSGSTVFGMFDSEKSARFAAEKLKKYNNEVFVAYSNEYDEIL